MLVVNADAHDRMGERMHALATSKLFKHHEKLNIAGDAEITPSSLVLELTVETLGGIGIGLDPKGDGRIIAVKPTGNGYKGGVLEEDYLMGYRYKELQPEDWDEAKDGKFVEEDTEFEGFTDIGAFLEFMADADGDPVVFQVSRVPPPSE